MSLNFKRVLIGFFILSSLQSILGCSSSSKKNTGSGTGLNMVAAAIAMGSGANANIMSVEKPPHTLLGPRTDGCSSGNIFVLNGGYIEGYAMPYASTQAGEGCQRVAIKCWNGKLEGPVSTIYSSCQQTP